MMTNRYAFVAAALFVTFLLTGCQTAQKSGSTASATPSAKTESPKATSAKAESPKATSAKAESPKDTQKDTQTVKGINGWEGEISGKPAPGSKFTRLKIGMGLKQVTDLIGQPNDQGAYMTGKAWIPFYYGSDRYRHELVYKGQGRLIFAGGSAGDYSSGHLTSIIHNAQESGYR